MSDVPDIEFGDTEPEDAWDPGDSFPVLVDNLFRRLAILDGDSSRQTRQSLLDIIEHRLARYRRLRERYDERDKLRIDQLVEDLDYLRNR